MTRKGLPSLREPYSQAQSSRVAVLIERVGEANGHGSSRIGGLAEPFLRGIACSCPIDVMFRFPAGWGQRRRTPARTDFEAEFDRSRCGSEPISANRALGRTTPPRQPEATSDATSSGRSGRPARTSASRSRTAASLPPPERTAASWRW